jgi:hypothetical protein
LVVRRSPLQFWSVICLLVLRLAFGEFAHAFPHDMAAADVAASSSGACPDHVQSQDDSASAIGEHVAAEQPAAETADCCKAGGCECPCFHATAMIASSAMPAPTSLDRSPAITCALGFVQHPVNRLFRPPA